MKNSIKVFLYIFLINFIFFNNSFSKESFEFNVTEIEIKENGNNIKGFNRGTIISDNGIIISADTFNYNKKSNFLSAEGNVSIEDKLNNYLILTDKINYDKNNELIITFKKSEAIIENITINAVTFKFDKNKNILNAITNVQIVDKINDVLIFSENINYIIDKKIIFSAGPTSSTIKSSYKFDAEDIYFNKNLNELNSELKASILVNNTNFYSFENFKFLINQEILKANKIYLKENSKKTNEESDELFFDEGIFDLKNENFIAGKTKINLKKNIFGNNKNDPRLIGISSKKNKDITTVNKAIFTSCENNDNCPPWSIKASKITHNKNKKQIIYDDAFLRVYDIPILYFPRFFHPDPSVKRQSGFLKPTLNNSNILGSSFSLPYFNVVSDNIDYTFTPTIFDKNNMFIIQNEYRQENKNSSFIADLSLVHNYKSTSSLSKNSISHIFSKFKKNLNFENFIKSDLNVSIEKTSNNLYTKLFDGVLGNSYLWPKNSSLLESGAEINLEHSDFFLNSGLKIYEDLTLNKNDSYQFILPYYNLTKNLIKNNYGTLNLISKGENSLENTNNLKTKIINDISFISKDYSLNRYGLINNYGIYLKNLNSLGKKDSKFKNSPQYEISNIIQFNTSLPLIKETNDHINFLIPKLSLRSNPSDMINYQNENRKVNAQNIFDINRLALDDTFESGTSLTIGLDYEKRDKIDNYKYLQLNLATSLRKNESDNIPSSSSLNKKNSNIFGSLNYGLNTNLDIKYNFMLDNKLKNINYNDIELNYSISNFDTKLNYIKETDIIGSSNFIENISNYKIDKNNFLSFKTRRNQAINLTEYYDLIYEYKNDCLTAGVSYKKSYYQDRDLKPSEDLMFTITFFPLTTFEQKIDQNLYRN